MTSAMRSATFLAIAVLGLASCEEGINLGQGPETDTTEAPAANLARGETRAGVRDVERADIFKVTDEALWDGRPSLGGVWVAHPDVKEPERAILINVKTGQRTAGALFRRERANPGPSIQLSSDAAAALNILAGQPTQVTVIAVRQEEVVIEPAPPVISDEEVGENAANADDDATPAATAAAGAAATGAAAAEAKPRRGNFLDRLFGKRTRKPAVAAVPEGTADSAAAPEVETQTLDPVASGAAAAIARADTEDKPAPRPARASAPASSDVKNPFIQVGLFSVEANAASAASNLRQAGIVPSVLQGERDGKTFWRIVVGPVNTADDQAAVLARVKRLGFSDAFLTAN